MSLTRSTILRTPRFAYGVRRYHTWPVIQVQTVADHTAQCLRIYLQIFRVVPPEVTAYLLWHDAGELVTGDLPFPVKARNPNLKQECDAIEARAVIEMGGKCPTLTEPVKNRVKIVDLIEMGEFGLVELRYGNTFAQPIVDDIFTAVDIRIRDLSVEDARVVREYVQHTRSILGGVECTS